jgi:hypothetical protein
MTASGTIQLSCCAAREYQGGVEHVRNTRPLTSMCLSLWLSVLTKMNDMEAPI